MAVSGSSFVDEICDQFLVCRMCSEMYNSPKVLTCMHSFCEKCLEAHYDMEEQERPYRFLVYNRALNCPLCHSRTELPTGGIHRLPDNLLVANLASVVGRRKPSPGNSAAVCEICRPPQSEAAVVDRAGRPAVSKCLDCGKLLCCACADLHRKTRVTEHHGLFDVRPELDADSSSECKRHQHEALRFYCEECEECVCVLCTFHDHRDHDVTTLVDALDRHRGPFEALMERCRGRMDGLRDQVRLIERCERGLKRAEERVRDAAIEAIAAIRRREKDLLAEIRDSLDEQTVGFIGEKTVFKENLKNLEGSFDATKAMLSGTKLDLLIVRKEMERKLTSVLESGMKQTPESLKQRNVRLFPEEEEGEEKDDYYYPDVVQAAFDRMAATSNRFVGRQGDGETGKQAVQVQTVATETDPEDFAPDLISKDDAADDLDSIRDSVWRRPMAVVVATETPRSFVTVTLRAIDGLPRTGETATQTPQPVVVVDRSTDMPRLVAYEKETNTPTVHVLQKGVSTDNQVMVDRSTSTLLVDVTAAYRGAATTTKRSVMVSRGTCTPRPMTADRETLSVPGPVQSTGRGCSPVDWVGVSAKSENETAGGGGHSPALQVPPNYSVDHVTAKSAQENPSTIRSNPAVVGVSSPAIVGVSSPHVVGVSSPPAVGVSSPAVVGVSSPPVVAVSSPPVVGVSSPVGVAITQAQYKQDELKPSPPATALHHPSPATVTVNTPTPSTVPTQVRPHEGQGSSRGQEVMKNPVHASAPLNQIQVGKVVIEEPMTLPRVQLMPASPGNKDLIRTVPTSSGSNPAPAIKGVQLYSQVLAPKSTNGTQIRSPGVQFPPGPPQSSQVRGQAPGSLPGSQSAIGNQRSQVRLQDSTNAPNVQTTPESQRFHSPGLSYMPTTQGSQVRTVGPASVPGVQSVLGTQGSQVRTIGPINVPFVQSVPGAQGQVRTGGPINLPGVQSIPGPQVQVRTAGPTNLPGVQSIPGTQGSQVRTAGPANVPGIQSIPGSQGQVRTAGPTNVPGVQSIPGTHGSQVRTVGPINVPTVQSIHGTHGGQVRTVGPANVPGIQSIPGPQGQVRTVGPTNVPGVQSVPGTQGSQIRTVGPINVSTVQSIPGTQGSQVRTPGPANVPGIQSMPGPQGQVRTVSPTNVPGVQSIPGTQGSQVRTAGPANVPGIQSIPGPQGQVRTVGPTNVPGVQSIPGTQGSQVRTAGPTNVPGTQFVPGTYGGMVGTQEAAVTGRVLPGAQIVSTIASRPTAAIVEAQSTLTAQEGQISRQSGETAKSMTSDGKHTIDKDPVSLSINDRRSQTLIQAQTSVQSVTGSRAHSNLPSEYSRQNMTSPTATPVNQDVTVTETGTMSPKAIATSVTGKSTCENINRGSNAIAESATANNRVPQSLLPSSILCPQTRGTIEAAGGAAEGNSAERSNPVDGVPSNAQSQPSINSPNIPSLASKILPNSFPSQQKPGGAIIIGGKGAAPPETSKSKMSSADNNASSSASTSGNLTPVSTSSSVSQLLVNDAAEHRPQIASVQEHVTRSGINKPDENPQNPGIPIGSDQQNPNPSTDRPAQSPHQKTVNPEK